MRTWMLPLLLKTTALLRCAAWCLFGTPVSRSEANGMLTRAETLTTRERAGIIANDVSSSLTRAVTFPSGHRDAAIGHRAAYGQAPPPDADRKMSLLLRELDALRDANKKLLERLNLKEEALQSKEAELMADTKQAKDWEGPSEFLEQLLSARKERDEAMMSRVLLANQERDEALRHVARLQQAAKSDASDGPALGDSDLEAEELLGRVCQAVSAQEVAHLGRALVEHVRLATQRRRHMAAQEMKAVMEQRDGSLAKMLAQMSTSLFDWSAVSTAAAGSLAGARAEAEQGRADQTSAGARRGLGRQETPGGGVNASQSQVRATRKSSAPR
ncbi:mirror-image polydactyly gene 1 protein isoform X3 [Syngnathus acus]|uniref:mirror-image polydactyly gene 1 protein isoform X3 n=1 Tax=Syngnathus acus TaxID=161584 RepID=UPI001885F314|nr:mirror-image polydactyly gene 1 protein isoform X3 [Syngnathus acus]